MGDFLRRLPEKTRDAIYTGLIALGLVLGSINVGYLAATGELPTWVMVANAVSLFLGVPTAGATARSNLPSNKQE